ncbi:response regulator [Desulfosediminicola ganghwensis]|uniref:response regulator n=1 Tax=Desulfosediminicola ganghwensis TaxID=2569540 RepID=UPI0010AC4879|nr:response regulator [Desulfosediminicola ganghwensis]
MKRVLIVDDSGNHRNQLTIILKKHGYELIEAENGEQAIEIAPKMHVDFILLDVIMPVIDGYQTCEIRKYQEPTQAVLINFLSAKNEISHRTFG